MPSVGDVTVDARVDGSRWPSDVRRIMRQVGRDMQKSADQHAGDYSTRFGSALRKQFTGVGRQALAAMGREYETSGGIHGRAYSRTLGDAIREGIRDTVDAAVNDLARLNSPTGFSELVKEMGDVDAASRRMRASLNQVVAAQAASRTEVNQAARAWQEQESALRNAMARETEHVGSVDRETSAIQRRVAALREAVRIDGNALKSLGGLIGGHDRAASATDRHRFAWSNLSHNTRQWTLIIGAVMAAMSQLAALGSALAGTIVALGTAFAGAGAGVAVAVAGFKGLNDEAIKLTPAAQAAKDAFSELGDTLKSVQGSITNAMFADMAPSIQAFRDQVSALEPFIASFAGVVGQNISKIFDALASPQAFDTFRAFLDNEGANFKTLLDSLTDAAIGFGSGLGGVMVAALPTAQKFADAIAEVGRSFGEWANSEAGRERLREWFETAEAIMPRVMDLLIAAGRAIAGLVTPQSIASTQGLLDSLTRFMPALEGILGILGRLNIFGVIAAALDTFGGALMPLMDPLQRLAGLISTSLIAGLQALAPWWTALANLIAPLIDSLVGFLEPILTKISNEVLPVLVGALVQVATQFQPVITAVQNLLAALAPIADFLIGVLLAAFQFVWPAIQAVIQVVVDAIVGTINGLTTFFQGLVDFVSGVFSGDWGQAWQGILDMVVGAFQAIWNFIQLTFIGKVVTGVKTALTSIGTFFKNTWDDIVKWVSDAIKMVDEVLKAVLKAIRDWWNNTWTGIGSFLKTTWTNITKWVDDAINAVYTNITMVMTNVRAWWDNIWAAISTAARVVWEAIKKFIGDAVNAVRQVITNVIQAVANWWANIWNTVKSTASNIWNGIKSVIDAAVNGIRSVIQNVIGAVKGWWERTLNAFKNTARDVWNGVKNAIKGPIDAIKGFIEGLAGPINAAIGWFQNLFGAASSAQGKASQAANSGGGNPKYASGGKVYGPTRALIGEAGPEAVVPLSRPLSQVDPSVRWLSAIAQGKHAPQAMASGGVSGGSQVNVAPGAFQVVGALDPRRTAIEVMNEFVERIA